MLAACNIRFIFPSNNCNHTIAEGVYCQNMLSWSLRFPFVRLWQIRCHLNINWRGTTPHSIKTPSKPYSAVLLFQQIFLTVPHTIQPAATVHRITCLVHAIGRLNFKKCSYVQATLIRTSNVGFRVAEKNIGKTRLFSGSEMHAILTDKNSISLWNYYCCSLGQFISELLIKLSTVFIDVYNTDAC